MGRLLLIAALAACGNVAKTASDASGPQDAPLPDALTCPTAQLECTGACVDPMVDHDHCGACDGACTDPEDCVAGHCTDDTASCFTIKQFNPGAPTAGYTHKLDGTKFFCDMTNNIQYDALGFGQYNVSHPGWTMVTIADLGTPTLQQAFIFLFNAQNGAKTITTWTTGSCCFKADMTANELLLGGSYLEPSLAATDTVECNISYADPVYRFTRNSIPEFAPRPLPDDYFTTNPATSADVCPLDNNDAAFFWSSHPL